MTKKKSKKKGKPAAAAVEPSAAAPASVPPSAVPGMGAMETVAIDSLKPDPRNARLHNQKNLEAIMTSLRRFGQQKPIVVDSGGTIRAGNGTWTAARELGWTQIAIVRSNLSEADLLAFALADNRSAELAEWDVEELNKTLQELATMDLPAIDLGFDDGQLEALLSGNVREAHGFVPAKEKKAPSAAPPPMAETFQILITCKGESHQADLLDRFAADGIECRALVA